MIKKTRFSSKWGSRRERVPGVKSFSGLAYLRIGLFESLNTFHLSIVAINRLCKDSEGGPMFAI